MIGLVFAFAVLAQAPEYVADYKPKVGDKVVLARDEAGRKVPVAKNDVAAMGFKDVIDESEFAYESVVEGSDELTEVDAGTQVQVVEGVKYLKEPLFFKIRFLDGPSKGKTAFGYTKFLRKPDPSHAKATAEIRKKRGTLDKKSIASEIKEALDKAKANESDGDLTEKKKIVRDAVNPICEKYKADYIEILGIAKGAGLVVELNAKKYDIAGNRLKK